MEQWIFCVGVGALGLPWNQLVNKIPISNDSQLINFDFEKEFGRKYSQTLEFASPTKEKAY
jgi:hypothetical protein